MCANAALVIARRDAVAFAKDATEVRQAVEAELKSDVGDTTLRLERILEHLGTLLEATAQDVPAYGVLAAGEDSVQVAQSDPQARRHHGGGKVRLREAPLYEFDNLLAVRRGETISVLDRDTPVAEIVPVRERSALRIRKRTPGTPPPNRIPLPKLLKLDIDIVQLLLEERQGLR